MPECTKKIELKASLHNSLDDWSEKVTRDLSDCGF